MIKIFSSGSPEYKAWIVFVIMLYPFIKIFYSYYRGRKWKYYSNPYPTRIEILPNSRNKTIFEDKIQNLSSDFVSIYNQAEIAEQSNANEKNKRHIGKPLCLKY